MKYQVKEALLGILSQSAATRERVLRENRHVFDMPRTEFERLVAEVASTEIAIRRMDRAEDARGNSGAYYYRKLYEKLLNANHFDRHDLMPPDPGVLLNHIRLFDYQSAGSVANKLADAAEESLSTEQLAEVIDRLARFPIPLPALVMNRIVALSCEDGDKLIRKLVKTVSSPLSTLHIVFILQTLGQPALMRLAKKLALRAFSDDSEPEFIAYSQFCSGPHRNLSPGRKLRGSPVGSAWHWHGRTRIRYSYTARR